MKLYFSRLRIFFNLFNSCKWGISHFNESFLSRFSSRSVQLYLKSKRHELSPQLASSIFDLNHSTPTPSHAFLRFYQLGLLNWCFVFDGQRSNKCLFCKGAHDDENVDRAERSGGCIGNRLSESRLRIRPCASSRKRAPSQERGSLKEERLVVMLVAHVSIRGGCRSFQEQAKVATSNYQAKESEKDPQPNGAEQPFIQIR